MSNKEEIINRYRDRTLGVVASGKWKNASFSEFCNENKLVEFLLDLANHETAFTYAGFEFLKEYYGLESVVDMISRRYPKFREDFGINESIIEWLNTKGKFAVEE